jgi:DNA ligase-1
MNSPWKIVADLESDNSKLAKQAIVRREAIAKNDEFFEGAKLCFDALITFGIAKIPESKKSGSGLSFADFKKEVIKLIDRKITGYAARDLVQSLCDRATIEQWNGWYRRILLKDLKCGMSESTINLVVYGDWVKKQWVAGIAPQYRITVFESQLASDSADHPNYMKGKKIIDTKMDGNRCLTVIWPKEQKVQQFSRNGKELVNFPNIVEQFKKVFNSFTEPTVIDAEIMSSSFQDLMKQVRRKTDIQTSDANLNIFDWLPLNKFLEGMDSTPQLKRSKTLKKWFDANQKYLPNVQLLEFEEVDLDTSAGQKRIKELIRLAAENGAEGIMVKDVNAGYECKRGKNWLKIKPNLTVDLKIIAVENGEAGKKYENILGGLVCEGTDKGKEIRVTVGGGFTEDQREEFWKNRKKLIGQTVEVKADAITKSENGDYYSLRFPRFERFRDDK